MSLESDVAVALTKIDDLWRVVMKGNGHKSLCDRVTDIENTLTEHLKDDQAAREEKEKRDAAMMNEKHTKDARKWDIQKSLIVLLVTVVVTNLVNILVGFLK